MNINDAHRAYGGRSVRSVRMEGRLSAGVGTGRYGCGMPLTGEHKRTLTGHTGRIESVAFSPDGSTLATGSWETVRLWDAATGRHKHTLTGYTDDANSVLFSPDGQTLASGSYSTVRLWDVITGKHKNAHSQDIRVRSIAYRSVQMDRR